LHVAKTLWALLTLANDGEVQTDSLDAAAEKGLAAVKHYAEKKLVTRAAWLANFYMQGTEAYEEDADGTRDTVVELNKRVYGIHDRHDQESPLAQIYWSCREWSYAYFDDFYARIGTHFEKYYPESETAPLGLQTVQEQLTKGVYEMSDGAVVFPGEKYDLHTRVFINSHGLPTYEAKDVGLIMSKWQDYHFDKSIVITGNDIVEYMKVVLKSIEQFAPELSQRSFHLAHGNVKLAGGVKMSSRKGNILRATDVLDIAAQANRELSGNDNEATVLGAVKYSFLKQRIGGDIIYEPEESVTLEGNSGPYLQYAHARARSILRKAEGTQAVEPTVELALEADERRLLRKISEYGEVIDKAVDELMPHHVCTYLYELAQAFNRFYEHNRVVGDERQFLRLLLVEQYAETLRNGLKLLGITAPDSM
jgi:arginyl-tRNA synthetase